MAVVGGLKIGTLDHGLVYEHAVWTHDAHWDDVAKKWVGLVALCLIAHSKVDWANDCELAEMSYLDCEVASNWCLMRQP